METPDIEFYLKNGLVEVFSLQHLQNFYSASLKKMIKLNRMSTILLKKNNLFLVATKNKFNEKIESVDINLIPNFKIKINDNIKKINELIIQNTNQSSLIALWGAGGFAVALFKLYKVKKKSAS